MKSLLHLIELPTDLTELGITATAAVALVLGFVLGGLVGTTAGKQTEWTAPWRQLRNWKSYDRHRLDAGVVTVAPPAYWRLSAILVPRRGRHRLTRDQMRRSSTADMS